MPDNTSSGYASSPDQPRLDLTVKLLYGIGEIPITASMVLIGLFAMYFYNSVMGLPSVWVGVAIASGLLFDALADPYIGYVSDRIQHRLGRRHSLMMAGSLAMGPCFFLLFSPPSSTGTWVLLGWLLSCSVGFRFAAAVYRIPYLSLGAELSTDYDERTEVIGIRSLFGLLGTLAAASLSFLLFFPVITDGRDPKLDYSGYPKLGFAFGALMTISGLTATIATLGRGQPDPVRVPGAPRFFRRFASAMGNVSFRSLWFSFGFFYLAVVLNATVAIHFYTWYVEVREGSALSGFQTAFYCGALAGVALWMALAKRYDKRSLYLASILALATLMAAAPAVFGQGRIFGTGNVFPLLIGYALAGGFASALWVIPFSMLADVVDDAQILTGERQEGIFFGILNFGEKLAAGFALVASGVLIRYFVGIAPETATQNPDVVERIGLAYGVVPAVLLGAAALAVLPYHLTRSSVARIQGQLRARTAPRCVTRPVPEASQIGETEAPADQAGDGKR